MEKHNYYSRILLYFFVKYCVFYFFLIIKDENYKLLKISSYKKVEDVLYLLLIYLPLPLICSIIFIFPFNYILKSKSYLIALVVFILFLLIEYFIYTSLASQLNLKNGLYNGLISLIIFVLMFYKQIKAIS